MKENNRKTVTACRNLKESVCVVHVGSGSGTALVQPVLRGVIFARKRRRDRPAGGEDTLFFDDNALGAIAAGYSKGRSREKYDGTFHYSLGNWL